jgi:outer membrane OprD family porin
VKLGENFINLYRYEYNTPYLNKNDNRMTPNTFEGYTFTGSYGGKDSAPGFRYGLGYIDKIKPRNSDTFISMSEAAGVKDADRGVFTGGGNVSYKGFNFGAINYYSNDIINIFYTEGSYKFNVTDRLGLLFSAQFTDQRSVGDNLLTGNAFSTNQFGVKSDISYGGAILTLGYSVDAQGADLQNPWSSFPGYTSVQVQDFNRAGENAFVAKLSYDFTRLCLEGLTAYALYVHGWNRINPSNGSSVPNENEFDADLQWRPQWKFLKGLWFRVRYADVHQYEGPGSTINDFRVIVNYDFSLF